MRSMVYISSTFTGMHTQHSLPRLCQTVLLPNQNLRIAPNSKEGPVIAMPLLLKYWHSNTDLDNYDHIKGINI